MPEEMDPLIEDKRGLFSSLAVAKGKGRVEGRRIGTLGFADVNCCIYTILSRNLSRSETELFGYWNVDKMRDSPRHQAGTLAWPVVTWAGERPITQFF